MSYCFISFIIFVAWFPDSSLTTDCVLRSKKDKNNRNEMRGPRRDVFKSVQKYLKKKNPDGDGIEDVHIAATGKERVP